MLRNFTPKTGLAILALFSIILTTNVSVANRRGDAKLVTKAAQNTKALLSSKDSPFSEDFEGETFPPAGWTTYALLNNQVNWSLGEWQNHTPGGTQSAFHGSTAGENSVDNWLVTPQISITSNGFHYLSFWSYLGSSWSYKKNSVLVSTGSSNPADGDFVEKWAGISNDGWMWAHFFLNLQEYVGQQVYIAFRYEGDSWGHTWNIDDVAVVDNSPSITVSNTEISQDVAINGTGLKIFEIGNQGIQELTFDIEIDYVSAEGWLSVNPISGTVSSQTQDTIILNFNATGLATGVYEANLIITSNDPVNPSVTVAITLNVVDVNIYPFVEGFESELFPPLGWSQFDMENDENVWALSWYNNTPGGQFSALHNFGWTPQDGWLVTPQITLPSEGFFYLSFWSMVGDAQFYGKNSVLVSTGSGNPGEADFVEVWTVAEVTENWTQYFINLEAYAGQDVYIAFRYEGDYAHFWAIDDISLGEEIDDSPVMNISTTEISQTTGLDGVGTKTFQVINDGIQNLIYNLEIEFTTGNGWLNAIPTSGSIPAKSSHTLSLDFDASGLSLGTYHANVIVTGNDTLNVADTLVAILTVLEAQPVNFSIIFPQYTFPTAISPDGQYVSGSQFGGENSYLWTRFSGTQDFAGEAMSVTDNGNAVGTYKSEFMFEGLEVNTAGIWNPNSQEWQFLGMNPDAPEIFGTFYNSAYGVTADGNTVVGMQWYADWNVRAFTWTEADGYDMLGTSTEYNTRANGISANGLVIYGWAEPNWSRTPVIWHNNAMIFIDETQYGEAAGASASGNYVTGSLGAGGFIWSHTEGVTLFTNTLNSGTLNPMTILDNGTAFGYTGEGFPPTPDQRRAFVRYPDGTMTTFNDYVQSRGWFDASDWIFFSINDVTPDGNKFIGAAELPSGDWISFMLDFEPGNPTIEVSQMSFTETLTSGDTATQTLVIENIGDGHLLYNAMVQYTTAEPNVQQVPVGEIYTSGQLELGKTKITGNKGAFAPKSTKNTTLNYDGDNVDAIGLLNGGTFYGAARFPSEMVAVYENYQLESVDVFVGNMPTTMKVMIWDAGTTTATGTLLHEQLVTPTESSWNHITLTTPVSVSGADLWVGFEVTHDAGMFVLGLDGGPSVQNGDWLSVNATEWEHLADYGLNGNWNIRANLTFNGMNWLRISPNTGILEATQSSDIAVTFLAAGLGIGTYTANIRISSNDAETPLTVIPVTLVVDSLSSVENMNAMTLTVFPNPASSNVTVVSKQTIVKCTITTILGQTVCSALVNKERVRLDVSNLTTGVYLLQIQTENGISVHKIQVNN
jgi:hypothetical protein